MDRVRTALALVAVALVATAVLTGPVPVGAVPAQDPPLAWGPAKPIALDLGGSDGESRVRGDGLDCEGDDPVEDVHLLVGAAVPAATISSLPATANANLGLAGHRLEPATSNLSLGDERGTLRFRLAGGACPSAGNLAPSGDQLTGNGPLELVTATGAYRSATFTGGSWSLAAATDPGADNPWALDVAGGLAVLAPGLQVQVVAAYWGNLGLDYVTRVVTVQYRITNPGPGDSFGSALTAVAAGPGVTVLGPLPQPLGDLLAGESRLVTVRYQLALLGPCQLVVLGCTFPTTLTTSLPDALDTPGTRSASASVTAPNLPPPL